MTTTLFGKKLLRNLQRSSEDRAYYLGDFDPSGFDLERDLREKLSRYSERPVFPMSRTDAGNTALGSTVAGGSPPRAVVWCRLAVEAKDFEEHNLIRLTPKVTDNRTKAFLREHGNASAEVDAIPPTELRHRVREAIEQHIDQDRWERLKRVEELERQTILTWGVEKPNLGSVSDESGVEA